MPAVVSTRSVLLHAVVSVVLSLWPFYRFLSLLRPAAVYTFDACSVTFYFAAVPSLWVFVVVL